MSRFKFKSLLCPTETVTADQLETDRKLLDFDRSIAQLNRRGFLGGMGGAVLAAALAGETLPASAQTTTPSVIDVLNFALNLEYLEANFYLYASSGAGVTATDAGSGAGAVSGGAKITLDAITLLIAQQLAADEVHHIQTLRSTITSLGGTPISQPAINLAAKGAVTTQAQFLATTRQFTAVGSSAYVGGSILLTSNATVLTAAAQILGAEGQHAGAVNYQCVVQNITSPALDALDYPPSSTRYITVDPNNALSPTRNSSQILGLVYGISTAATVTPPTGTSAGGFFPNGLNGNIKST